jgi:hypothetical protein
MNQAASCCDRGKPNPCEIYQTLSASRSNSLGLYCRSAEILFLSVYALPGGSSSFDAILTSSASESACIFRIT